MNTGSNCSKNHGFLCIFLFITLLLLGTTCTQERKSSFPKQNLKEWKRRISQSSYPIDSLRILLAQSERDGNDSIYTILARLLGQRMRDKSRFSEAITYHQKGLDAALRTKDTLSIAQILNQLGTDFRRIAAFPEASDYHFKALRLSEDYSQGNSFPGKKNKVKALNGIGNIYLSLKNLPEADKYFREALVHEKELHSPLGQAINYANIGSIHLMMQQYDSAFLYYRYSMEQNIVAKSKLGVGICHIHFGEIYERQQDFHNAEIEYRKAYEIMQNISDTWHWLRACLSLGQINLLKGNIDKAQEYILRAKKEAEKINTPEHISKVYDLLYQLYEQKGNYRQALNMYLISKAYQDSTQNISKINQAIDMRINYEREKSMLRIDQLNAQYESQKREKKIIITASIITFILLILFLAALAYAYRHRIRSNKILKNVDKMRSDFFTNVTHEFRTPLTIILGFIAHMKRHQKMPRSEYLSYLKAMEKQGDKLLQLVNRMLNMAKMEAGMESPEWKTGDIIAYLRMLTESYRLFAQEKRIELNFYSEVSALQMDLVPHYIDEIVRNLLSNAIKFTEPGGEITLSVFNSLNNEVLISVRDNGKGIPAEDLERIFEAFYQVSDMDGNSGSGIGLHYTQQLTEAMHGKISVESQMGAGSVFSLRLPVKQQKTTPFPPLHIAKKQKENPPQEKQTANTENAETSILLVEDNKDILFYIQSLLPENYKLILAKDGQEGIELANELLPDLIISDVMMPIKDGFALCREVKQSELLNHIPVILLTAKTTLEDQLMGLEAGADAYIRKPFNPNELLIRIEKLLENRRILKEKYIRNLFKDKEKNLQKTETDVNIDFLRRVTDIIYDQMQNPHFSPTMLADKLCLSLSQLNRKMTAISGYNPSSYVLHLRIDKAKKKLASGDSAITQIADECGFYDLAHFSRSFKKQTGITPSQYRRLPN